MHWRFSDHALQRAQERAISVAAVEATLEFGSRRRAANGSAAYTIDLAAIRRARAYGRDISGFMWVEAVLAGGVVATVYRLDRAQRRGRRRREERHFAREQAADDG